MAVVRASHVLVVSALLVLPAPAAVAATDYVGSPGVPGDYVGSPPPPEDPGDYVGSFTPEGPGDYVGNPRAALSLRAGGAAEDLEPLPAVPSPPEEERPVPSLPVSRSDVAGLAGLAGVGIAGIAYRRLIRPRYEAPRG